MKLRLFAIRDTQSNKLIPDTYYASKPEAKCARDKLNKGTARYVVTPGPDHHKACWRKPWSCPASALS